MTLRTFIDADILIWHLRGEQRASHFLRSIAKDPEQTLWIGAMQRAEVVFFMRPGEEELTFTFLSQFQTATIDEGIVDYAANLYRKWLPSHRVDINDMILAATVALYGGRIFTLNRKHFPMKDIVVTRPW